MIVVRQFEYLKIGRSLVGVHDLWNGAEDFLDSPLVEIVSIRGCGAVLSR